MSIMIWGLAQKVKGPIYAALSEPRAVATGPKLELKWRADLMTLAMTVEFRAGRYRSRF